MGLGEKQQTIAIMTRPRSTNHVPDHAAKLFCILGPNLGCIEVYTTPNNITVQYWSGYNITNIFPIVDEPPKKLLKRNSELTGYFIFPIH